MKTINVSEYKKLLAEKGGNRAFIDVRTPAEFKEAHIAGMKNIPLDQLDKHKAELAKYDEVYVLCRSGNRSSYAISQLQDINCTCVNVEGGITAWQEQGFETNIKAGAFPIMRQVMIVAGSMILLGVILSIILHPYWVYLSGFVGLGLLFSGLTGHCGMVYLLGKMPWNK